jgi:hypothetical protein
LKRLATPSVFQIPFHLKEVKLKSMEWIRLAQDKNKWRILKNAVISHQDPAIRVIF